MEGEKTACVVPVYLQTKYMKAKLVLLLKKT